MNQKSIEINIKKRNNHYIKIIYILIFLVGILNSQEYIINLGYRHLSNGIQVFIYILILIMFFLMLVDFSYRIGRFKFYSFPYWRILSLAIIFKLFILFIQNPQDFFVGGKFFYRYISYMLNISLLIVLAKVIQTQNEVKNVVLALGLGTVLSAIIPFIFYPEMIGVRIGTAYNINGSFWNYSLISFISVGWLLIAVTSFYKSKIIKLISSAIVILLILASLAGLSRAALVSFMLSFIIYLFFTKKFFKNLKYLGAIAIVLILMINIFPEVINNFQGRLDGGIVVQEEARMKIWKEYIADIPNYFLFGQIQGDYTIYSSSGNPPHSVLLNWLVQFGILGFTGFIVLFIGVIKSIRSISQFSETQVVAGLYAWLVSYFSVALINETGFSELSVFAAIGIILAWGNISKKSRNTGVLNIM